MMDIRARKIFTYFTLAIFINRNILIKIFCVIKIQFTKMRINFGMSSISRR